MYRTERFHADPARVVQGGGSHVFGGRARQLLAEGSERVAWAHLSSMKIGLFTRAQNQRALTSVKSYYLRSVEDVKSRFLQNGWA